MAKAPAGDSEQQEAQAAQNDDQATQTRVRWDAANMRNTYANVCNVSSTREEVTLLFGTNQTWYTGQDELTVQLSDRMVMNPFAAKRLSILLSNVLAEYESRFGELAVEGGDGAGAQEQT